MNVVSSAKRYVLLVSPSIRFGALEKIMNVIPDSVRELDCVTRWTPNDLGRRLCDLEVFNLLANRKGARLWNREDLHAKFVRGDDRCLVGSGDLTFAALGWNLPFNCELKIEVPSHFPGLGEWEKALFAGSHLVTSRSNGDLIEKTKTTTTPQPPHRSNKVDQKKNHCCYWIPQCPRPEKLYRIYAGLIDISEMASTTYELARRDLHDLDPPLGHTPEINFNSIIASRLMETSIFKNIISLSRSGISDYHATQVIISLIDESCGIKPENAWERIRLWILHFFSYEFRTESHQEVLVERSLDSG